MGFCVVPRVSSVEVLVEHFRLADEMGIEYGWLADQTFSPSAYSVLTLAAYLTKRIKLGTSVTNPYTRHPVIHATTGAVIDELSNGRFMLGIGAGDESSIKSLGLGYDKPVSMVRETVEAVRRLLRGEKVTCRGKALNISNVRLMFKPKRVFPIHVGARGPRMLRLAGEIGDGVLIDASNPVEAKIALTEIRKGLDKAGKKQEEIEITATVVFAVDEDSEKAREKIKWLVALIAASALPEVLERHEIHPDFVKLLKVHLERKGLEGVSELVKNEMIDAFALVGSPEECIAKIEEMTKTGVSHVALGIMDLAGADVRHQVKLVGEKILPHFK